MAEISNILGNSKNDLSIFSNVAFTGNYNDLLNSPINLSFFNNDVGYLTEYIEEDPIFTTWLLNNPVSSYNLDTVTTNGNSTENLITVGGITAGIFHTDGYIFNVGLESDFNMQYIPYVGLLITDPQVTNSSYSNTNIYPGQIQAAIRETNGRFGSTTISQEGVDFTIGFESLAPEYVGRLNRNGLELKTNITGGSGIIKSDLVTNGYTTYQLPSLSGNIALTSDIDEAIAGLDALSRDGSNANQDVDLGTSFGIKASTVTIQNNGASKSMKLLASNLQDVRSAEWQDMDYVGIADISDVNNAIASANTYTDNSINNASIGLLKDVGNFNASTTGSYPTTPNPIKKGYTWTVSVDGTIGGINVTVGDVVRALVDAPGQTASNWVITENNIGYVPENKDNKVNTITGAEVNSSLYASLVATLNYFTGSKIRSLLGITTLSGSNTGDQDLSGKVDKVTGKSLILDTEITRISTMATNANVGVVPNTAITGATKTKVTYDSKGLVTSGTDATTSDITDSSNKRYVTDAQLVVLGNTSGTNTGDNAINSLYSGLVASKEDTANKTDIMTGNTTSSIKFLSAKGVFDYIISLGYTTTSYVTSVLASFKTTNFLDFTSSGQTQINSKENTITPTTTADYYRGDKTFQSLESAVSAFGYLLASTAASTYQAILTATNFGTFSNGLLAKLSLVDADTFNISDSADTNKSKKVSLTTLKSFLKTYFDTLYQGILVSGTTIIRNATAYTDLVGGTGLRTMFGTSLTVEANSVYEFEWNFALSSINTLSGTFSTGILGTAGISSIFYNATANKNLSLTTAQMMNFTTFNASILSVSNTATTARASIKGTFTTNATPGTIIPAYAVSVSANPVTDANGLFKIIKIG